MFDEDSTKYGLIDSLAPSSKIIATESMDGTIGDVYNKEVRRRVMDQSDTILHRCVFMTWLNLNSDVTEVEYF